MPVRTRPREHNRRRVTRKSGRQRDAISLQFAPCQGDGLQYRFVDVRRDLARKRSCSERANALGHVAGSIAVLDNIPGGFARLIQVRWLIVEPA